MPIVDLNYTVLNTLLDLICLDFFLPVNTVTNLAGIYAKGDL